jgi:hypothetical protein
MRKIITASLLPLLAAIVLVASGIMLTQPPLPTYGQDTSIEELIQDRASESEATTPPLISSPPQQPSQTTTTTNTTTPPSTSGGQFTVPVPTNATLPITGARLSPIAQQIIIDIQTQCREQAIIILEQCVNVWHESPTTLVLNGETLILASPGTGPIGGETTEETFGEEFESNLGNYPNIYIWEAVDRFKEQGYTLTSVMMAGQGTQGNPHEFFVVMSK